MSPVAINTLNRESEFVIPLTTVMSRVAYDEEREENNVLSIYNVFIYGALALSAFFAVSLVLSLATSHYFISWASSIIGLVGTAGLALVGLFAKRQLKD